MKKGFRQNSFKCGHAFVEENISRSGEGKTRCKTCANRRSLEWAAENHERILDLNRAWYRRNIERVRDSKRRLWYKLTTPEWEVKFESQGRCCAICKSLEPHDKNWNTDHDHACCPTNRTCGKCIRSILCGPCNLGLGGFQDTPEWLRAAADYIEFWRKQHGRSGSGGVVQRAPSS
jgi:hypothetical protein